MASDVLPQVLVFQESRVTPTPVEAPRQAHLTGGHARLFRYDDADEKALVSLGEYDPVVDAAYDWPNRPLGSKVDLGYAKVFVDGAKLRFFQDLTGVGGGVAPVSGYKNRVRSASHAFKSNGDAYPRSASLYDRDVKVGDTAYVRGVGVDSENYELWTSVRGFVGEVVDASVAAVADATTNKATQSASVSIDNLGVKNTITLTADASGYDRRATGDIEDTYTIEVTQGSVGGDLTTARLRVTTASGRDQASNVQPSAVGGFTAIGAGGLLIEFDRNETNSASSAAGLDEVSPDDLVPGHKWRVSVTQDFTAPTATSGGGYTGTKATTYIVEVTKGGAFADNPTVTVTTTTGIDKSGPTIVSAAATAVSVGTKTVTVSFSGVSGLCKGDKYYIDVEPETAGSLQTLVLADDLPTEIQGVADLDLKLFITKDLELPSGSVTAPPATNWDATATELTLQSGITLYDSTVTDGGVEVAIPLEGGELFVEYRAWMSTYVSEFESASGVDEVESLLAPIHPDNPLGWGAYMAALNSDDQAVRFTAVEDPDDTDSWLEALDILVGRPDFYNAVPLTANTTVCDAWKAYANSESSPENGKWRGVVVGIDVARTLAVVDEATTSDGEPALATLSDDPATSGTQYTILSVPAGNAKFETRNVRPGDIVRYLYSTDGFGNDTYSEFTVDEVLSEDSLRLASGHTVAINVAQRVEIWHTRTPAELATAAAQACGRFADRRVLAVANDTVGQAGRTFAGYFLAAAVAGIRSAINPHQALTNISVSGIDDAGSLVTGFNGSHLKQVVNAGGLVVRKTVSGAFVIVKGTTTDPTDLNSTEESIRVNVDSISYELRDVLAPFIGQSNVTEDTLNAIRGELVSALDSKLVNNTPRIGPRLNGYEIVRVSRHATLKDRVVVIVNLDVPAPINNIELRLVV